MALGWTSPLLMVAVVLAAAANEAHAAQAHSDWPFRYATSTDNQLCLTPCTPNHANQPEVRRCHTSLDAGMVLCNELEAFTPTYYVAKHQQTQYDVCYSLCKQMPGHAGNWCWVKPDGAWDTCNPGPNNQPL